MKAFLVTVILTFGSVCTIAQDDRTASQDTFIVIDEPPEPFESLSNLIVYPIEAKENGIEGKVIVSALIDTFGTVLKTRIIESTNEIFNEPASKALLQSRFKPAKHDGVTIKLWYAIPISFRLDKE